MTQDRNQADATTARDAELPDGPAAPHGDPLADTAQRAAGQGAQAPAAGEAQTSPPPGGPAADGATAEPGSGVKAEIDEAQRLVEGLTEDLKRLQAEYVNYKRRVDRDRELVLENAKFSVLSALFPVLDDVDRAREHGELEGGFKAVAESLERIVASQGLVKFGAPGDEFDPHLHEALMHAHSPDVTTTTCRDVVSAGYKIGDRVVRPARVTVVDPEPAADQD